MYSHIHVCVCVCTHTKLQFLVRRRKHTLEKPLSVQLQFIQEEEEREKKRREGERDGRKLEVKKKKISKDLTQKKHKLENERARHTIIWGNVRVDLNSTHQQKRMGKFLVCWLHWYPIYQQLLAPLKAEFTADREAELKICPSRWTESVGDAVFQRLGQSPYHWMWSQRGSEATGAREPANDLLDPGWAELTAGTSLIPQVILEDINLVWTHDEGRFSRRTPGIMKSPRPEKVCPNHFSHKSNWLPEEG